MAMLVPGGSTVGAYGGWMLGGGHNALASKYGLGAEQPLSLQVVTTDGRFVVASPDENEDLFYALRGARPGTFGIITSSTSYSFTTTVDLPGYTSDELISFMQPLNSAFHTLGIPANSTTSTASLSWGSNRHGKSDTPRDSRFASRLFPRSTWEDDSKFNATMATIRKTIEAGYIFHRIHMSPTVPIAGYPGNNEVNPAFRNAIIHADSFEAIGNESSPFPTPSMQSRKDAEARSNSYINLIRAVTPEGGSYINEADFQEPKWPESFFRDKYEKLVGLKGKWNPWDYFGRRRP